MLSDLLLRSQDTVSKTYVEDVFSTYLYTGNGTSQTITNGINLSTNGGLVWIKGRAATDHGLYDTARGATAELTSTSSASQNTQTQGLTAFNSNGFSVGNITKINNSGASYASWTFRKAAKYFDIVTYTGNNTAGRTISHSLGSVPGMIIVKCLNNPQDWIVWHQGFGNGFCLLDSTNAFSADNGTYWGNGSTYIAPTSTTFTIGSAAAVNINAKNFVAYVFGHDTTSDGLIQCGSFTTNSSGAATVSLGWEPQFLLVKSSGSATTNWQLFDNMRGIFTGLNDALLLANATSAETIAANYADLNATGFSVSGQAVSSSYVYMAIRRPMRTPTDGTTVFQPLTRTGTGTSSLVTTSITADLLINKIRGSANAAVSLDRMRDNAYLFTTSNGAEVVSTTIAPTQMFDNQSGFDVTGTNLSFNSASGSYISYVFKRAPSFMDIVCYTGTGTATSINHSLGVAPELMLIKARSGATVAFNVYAGSNTSALILNTTAAPATSSTYWNNTSPTATQFTVGTAAGVNTSAATYVAYLFASCPGVSKVGTYTGNGSSLDVNCGFSSGARFVLIKRTDTTGDWFVFDTARGIVSATEPYWLMNTTAAEVSTTDSIDPLSSGFTVVQDATTNINVSSGTYIFLAIA